MAGAFTSFLDWMDEVGQVPKNLLRGNPGAAGRNFLDALGDVVDAPLPGDWIPHIAKREDKVSGGELLGLKEPGPLKAVADVIIDTATNPLSLLTFGKGKGIGILGKTVAGDGMTLDPLSLALKGAGKAATGGAKAVDRLLTPAASTVPSTVAQDTLARANRTVRNALGWHDLTPEQREVLDRAKAAGNTAAKAGTMAGQAALRGLTSAEQVALGDAFDGILWQGGKPAGLVPGATVADRLRHLAQLDPSLRLPELAKAAEDVQRLHVMQWEEGKRLGVFSDQSPHGRPDYLQRQFTTPIGDDELVLGRPGGGGAAPNLTKGRQLETPEALLDYLQKHPENGYERNALRRVLARAAGQGTAVERAALGKAIAPGFGALADAGDRSIAQETIRELAKTAPDYAYRLDQAFNGMAPRGWFSTLLAGSNRVFKPAAVYGVVIPKVGSIVRNQMGMAWQALSTPGVPLSTQRHAVGNLLQAFDDGWAAVTGSRLGGGKLTRDLADIEHAFKASGGSAEAVTAQLRAAHRPDLAEAVEHGVMDGFVSTEEIIKGTLREGWKGKAADIYHMPGTIFKGVEDRGRLATFLDLRERYGAAKAAQLVKDAYLDYSVTGTANRTLRDVIPFASWIAGTVPQQAKFLSRTPAAAAAVAAVMGQGRDEPVYPYLEDKTRIPLGVDDKGNPQYAVGLGLPVETLAQIPDLSGSLLDAGRSIKRNVLASAQPLLKSAAGYITGEDPYFETPYGSYGKLPTSDQDSAAGRAWNQLAGAGVIEPIEANVRTAAKVVDPNRSAGLKALDLLTGTNVVSVDLDRAEQQQLREELRRHPEIRQRVDYYQTGDDADIKELLGKFRDAKDRLKEKRRAAEVL